MRGTIDGDRFSDELRLTTEIDQEMQFYGYQECNDSQGHMKSFNLILSDSNKENRVKMDTVGVEIESETCPGYVFPSPYI